MPSSVWGAVIQSPGSVGVKILTVIRIASGERLAGFSWTFWPPKMSRYWRKIIRRAASVWRAFRGLFGPKMSKILDIPAFSHPVPWVAALSWVSMLWGTGPTSLAFGAGPSPRPPRPLVVEAIPLGASNFRGDCKRGRFMSWGGLCPRLPQRGRHPVPWVSMPWGPPQWKARGEVWSRIALGVDALGVDALGVLGVLGVIQSPGAVYSLALPIGARFILGAVRSVCVWKN